MASELRFDGRVAIVTGAGGNPGLGRSYALLLAERGAKVVVNDLGVGPDGRGVRRASAELVVEEIRDAGGEAVADTNSVADEAGAQAIVRTALDTWGRVDALVNNAGVAHLALFDEVSSADLQRIVSVHLMGNIWMCRAAWPAMTAAGYGRIVNIASAAMFGLSRSTIYGAAKGGIYGLSRGLAVEGDRFGIKVNTVGPAAGTAAILHFNDESEWVRSVFEHTKPEQVAPAVALLAHDQCPCSGKYLEVGGGRVAEKFVGETAGYTNPELTIEDLVDNLDAVLDRSSATMLGDLGIGLETRNTRPRAYEPSAT